MKYLIIGNSAAAVGAVEAIRRNDKGNPITIISDEPHHVYSRPLISYLLAGHTKEDKMYYRDENFYKENNVETVFNKRVTGVDTKKKQVILEDKKKIDYDKLLIATGGTPFVPPIKGKDRKNVYTFTKWSDAEEIIKISKKVQKVVVIGAGMIGLKAIEGLNAIGIDVTVVELAPEVLSRALDKDASRIVQRKMEEAGVEVITNNEVVEITGKGNVATGVVLRDKKKIKCDLVIVAIGVIPNTGFIKESGIKINRGIVVDERMETNIKGVYAAGDVVEALNMLTNEKMPIPIWPLAYRQGSIAGDNMSGGTLVYKGGFPMNSIEFPGAPTISLGIIDPRGEGYESLIKNDAKNGNYKRIIIKNERLVGAILVGDDVDRAGILTGLIKEQKPVTAFKDKLLDRNFGFVHMPREHRREKLEKAI
ncbi:MAG: pyridine nucleotide-disulfide oxidoreductase [Nitrospinae bacterium RIFCSPLOWO2_12_39_16]|nr:MAG: pyridine nucleotide-disulfide oxidoreductase [Nitrospinae bacterium RIFCSPLOWO2_12_39_16]HLA47896.1 FAD-dependent oxidoreductase [Nitrospinota bacterium]